jgi:1-deoxy-D-xylulose-5-phosphate reductoisomerase
MCSISGLSGLQPTLEAIKFSKKVAIANKESIICGWSLINKNLKKYKTNFIPVDSEHYSIWNLVQDYKNSEIEKVIITASGGPFLNLPINDFKNIRVKDAINHPNWRMGKKISVDSATLMNKVFEVIEALKIFKIDKKKFKILIHPKSYVHAIIKFNNGLTKILLHDTNMKIPIFNSIYSEKKNKRITTKKINLKILNNLNLSEVNLKKFPSVKILNKISKLNSLFETVLVSANDELVDLFLSKKISFNQIVIKLNKIITNKFFIKYKKKVPKSVNDIHKLNNLVRLKTKSLSV